MAFSIPQAAAAIRSLWLDDPAAFSPEDAPHILGLYRYDFTVSVSQPPVFVRRGGWKPLTQLKKKDYVDEIGGYAGFTDDDEDLLVLLFED